MGHGACRQSCKFEMQPIPHIWMAATNRHLGWPRKAAILSVMDSSDQFTHRSPYLRDWKSLTLLFRMGQGAWYDYFWFGRQPIPRLWMAATNCHIGYPRVQATMVDALLKLIFRMGQWMRRWLFCQKRPPVWLLWLAPTTSPFNYRTYKTDNH
jgi:hypothetical protein